MSSATVKAIDRPSKVILWLFLAFNLMIAASLVFDPGQIDAQYRGGPLTVTREFQWFSVASFHLFMAAVTGISLAMSSPRERCWLHVANASFYLWDAATQWGYWGGRVGLDSATLHTNAGVSAGVGALLLVVWWRERRAKSAELTGPTGGRSPAP